MPNLVIHSYIAGRAIEQLSFKSEFDKYQFILGNFFPDLGMDVFFKSSNHIAHRVSHFDHIAPTRGWEKELFKEFVGDTPITRENFPFLCGVMMHYIADRKLNEVYYSKYTKKEGDTAYVLKDGTWTLADQIQLKTPATDGKILREIKWNDMKVFTKHVIQTQSQVLVYPKFMDKMDYIANEFDPFKITKADIENMGKTVQDQIESYKQLDIDYLVMNDEECTKLIDEMILCGMDFIKYLYDHYGADLLEYGKDV